MAVTADRNTLKKFHALSPDDLAAVQKQSGVDLGRRPETLEAQEFVRLLHALPSPTSSGSEA